MNDPAAARRYHEATKHASTPDGIAWARGVEFVRTERHRPRPFKEWSGGAVIPLPTDFADTGCPAVEALARPASQSGRAPAAGDIAGIARVLYLSAGVTRTRRGSPMRAAPSAGNRHPLVVYAVVRDVAGLAPGVYAFEPGTFALVTVRPGDAAGALAAATSSPAVASAQVSLVVTGVPWVTCWHYRERGYRHLWWDAGTMLANTIAVSAASGARAPLVTAFDDAAVAEVVGVDNAHEFPLVVVPLLEAGASAATGTNVDGRLGPPLATGKPWAEEVVVLPLVAGTHAASGLAGAAAVEDWRQRATQGHATLLAPPSSSSLASTPLPPAGAGSIEDVVLRRGSTREFRRGPLPEASARWMLHVAAQPVEGDFAGGGATLLEHAVAVHAVDGMTSGTYRLLAGEPELIEDGDVRDRTEHVCAGQSLGGDAAFTAFHFTALDGVLDALGSRGYGLAQLEAGIVSGRLQLAAFAAGAGATGLTFLDDEASRLFGTDAACMLVTAVGTPAYHAVPGGRPGRPAQLKGRRPRR